MQQRPASACRAYSITTLKQCNAAPAQRTMYATLMVTTRRSRHAIKRQLHISAPSDGRGPPHILGGAESSHSTQVPVLLLLVQGGTVPRQDARRWDVDASAAAALSASSCHASRRYSGAHSDATQMASASGAPQASASAPRLLLMKVVLVLFNAVPLMLDVLFVVVPDDDVTVAPPVGGISQPGTPPHKQGLFLHCIAAAAGGASRSTAVHQRAGKNLHANSQGLEACDASRLRAGEEGCVEPGARDGALQPVIGDVHLRCAVDQPRPRVRDAAGQHVVRQPQQPQRRPARPASRQWTCSVGGGAALSLERCMKACMLLPWHTHLKTSCWTHQVPRP